MKPANILLPPPPRLFESEKMDESQECSSCGTGVHNPSSSNSSHSSPPSSKCDRDPRCNGVPERRNLLRISESHGLQLLSVLRSFREHGLMFDFTIKVQGHSFPSHRCVIAACSDFFRYFIYLTIYLSIYPPIRLSIYLYIYLLFQENF